VKHTSFTNSNESVANITSL